MICSHSLPYVLKPPVIFVHKYSSTSNYYIAEQTVRMHNLNQKAEKHYVKRGVSGYRLRTNHPTKILLTLYIVHHMYMLVRSALFTLRRTTRTSNSVSI